MFHECSRSASPARRVAASAGILVALALLALPLAAQAGDDGIQGVWREPDGGRIEISACGDLICGHVLADDPQPADGSDYTGYAVLTGFQYEGDGRWAGGTVHDPRDDKAYRSHLTLLDENRLKVSGCLWIFCGSQTWTRVE